ncbi:MAG: hypothetical protein AAFO94_05075, partial [Bacteroidota bacterium]
MPSDLDFNVWGPFTSSDACNDPQTIVDFILNNQPIRSSYSGGNDPTGMVRTHPETGIAVTDAFDCDPQPGPNGDDFTSVIEAQQGELYFVLLNDWQDNIVSNGIRIDWSPSSANLVLPDPVIVTKGDTAICQGDMAQLEISSNLTTITWSPDNTLSCNDCLNPTASPTENTTYTAVISGACQNDTINIEVRILEVDLGEDRTVCRNEMFQLVAGEAFPNATYSWVDPGNFLSCTDCPDPMVDASTPGDYEIIVVLTSGSCELRDTMNLSVRTELAPEFSIIENDSICVGDNINIGGANVPGVSYTWRDGNGAFVSNISDPDVMPLTTTTYILEAQTAGCPIVSTDSVTITVFSPPVVNVAADAEICEGDSVVLAATAPQPNVTYSWSPTNGLNESDIPNPTAKPNSTTTYTLTATRGACVVMEDIVVDVTQIRAEILNPDTVLACLGERPLLQADLRPDGITGTWTPGEFLNTNTGPVVETSATDDITYYIRVEVPNGPGGMACVRVDSVFVQVDSLPADLSIMPQDTTICEGENVILTSPIFEPALYSDIEFMWAPPVGQLTGDSLYNMVAQPTDTTTYFRTTRNGGCVSLDSTTVNVKPITTIVVEPAQPRVCVGESIQLQITNEETLEELMWMPPDGLSCTECLNPTAGPPFTTDYQIMAEVDGCPAEGQVTVEVLSPPSGPDGGIIICEGSSVNLNPNARSFETYTWTSNPNDPTLTNPNDPSPIVTPTQNTTYTATVDNMVCDVSTFEVDVIVVGDATLTVEDDQRVCAGETLSLTANGTQPGNYR